MLWVESFLLRAAYVLMSTYMGFKFKSGYRVYATLHSAAALVPSTAHFLHVPPERPSRECVEAGEEPYVEARRV